MRWRSCSFLKISIIADNYGYYNNGYHVIIFFITIKVIARYKNERYIFANSELTLELYNVFTRLK